MKVSLVDLRAQYLTIKDEIDAAISSVIVDSAYIGGAHLEAFRAGVGEGRRGAPPRVVHQRHRRADDRHLRPGCLLYTSPSPRDS